jgi:hypothetical protein
MPAIGESALPEGGFRRVSPPPEPLALARMRSLLLEATLGGSDPLHAALEGFGSWRFLAPLSGSAWTAGARRDSVATRRVLRRRLLTLAAPPMSAAEAAGLPSGSPVHLLGTAKTMLPGRMSSHIWSRSTLDTDNVRFEVEEGHDFLLSPNTGELTCVMVARGHLTNAETLADGDVVSVFGTVDRVIRPATWPTPSGARRELVLAVRSGDDLPLMIRRVGLR